MQNILEPLPIATDADGACRYLGCSITMLEKLRKQYDLKPLARDWYSYDDLDAAMRRYRDLRDGANTYEHVENSETIPGKAPARNVGRKGPRPRYSFTKDVLCQIR